jgi:hypothetical protein
MPVSHKKETVKIILHPDPVFQDTVVMADMQLSGRPHAADNSLFHMENTP